jgi:hypothetical protein
LISGIQIIYDEFDWNENLNREAITVSICSIVYWCLDFGYLISGKQMIVDEVDEVEDMKAGYIEWVRRIGRKKW